MVIFVWEASIDFRIREANEFDELRMFFLDVMWGNHVNLLSSMTPIHKIYEYIGIGNGNEGV